MIEREILELIHAEIDGVNSPEDSARLRTHLQRNTDNNDWYEDLERITNAMRSAGLADPPPGALKRALASIPFQDPRPSTVHTGGFQYWIANAFRRPVVAFGSSFAMGAVVATVLLVALNPEVSNHFSRSLDISDISGTIGNIDDARDFDLVGSVDVDLSTVEASIRLLQHTNDALLIADLSVRSNTLIECVLDYGGAGLSFEGIRRFSDSGESLFAGQSEVRISHKGDDRYLLSFARTSGTPVSMTIRIYEAGELVLERVVTTH
jgi:hypothetical protein